MAVNKEGPVKVFADWYDKCEVHMRSGLYENFNINKFAHSLQKRFKEYKREMDARCKGFDELEAVADAEVVSKKPDLPNVSSGESAGIVRRMARNLVQNTPNLEVRSKFDDDSREGILARHLLLSRVVESDAYSNDAQQNLFASTKTALTVGFDCVIPVLQERADGGWYMKYDTIHYRDVFPEPGAKDVRDATEVFVRRYLTKGEVLGLIRTDAEGWDPVALKTMINRAPSAPPRESQSRSHQDKKRGITPSGYSVITWYTDTGDPFLTFDETTGMLLRIEKNTHPLKWHPVFFLILEKDSQHPLGKSQVELIFGRQEFQDLMHNGAMKLWYRNINPPLIGYGSMNAIPNLSPGKYTPISNPNAKIEAFEINTQTLLQYPNIAQNNLGSMVNLVGSADQQMAVQAGNGMSATPQGVDAQQTMVDITTNNYQKAIESFYSRYCSYALTIFFQEMKGVSEIPVNADTRRALVGAGMEAEAFDEKTGNLQVDMRLMATNYYVRCVPGSLVELEDEKQLRILNELFVPLSQAMPALAQVQDQQILQNAALTMQFIIQKEIELSGSHSAKDLEALWTTGTTNPMGAGAAPEESVLEIDNVLGESVTSAVEGQEYILASINQLQEQIRLISETQAALLEKLGVSNDTSGEETTMSEEEEALYS